MEEETIRAKAALFGKSGKSLTKYQERMNEIAGDICLKDVSMLADKGKLLQQARLKLHESGYVYSKGKLRSKILNPEVTKHDKPRRERIDKKEHKHRIESLQDEMKDINKHVTVKRGVLSRHRLQRILNFVTSYLMKLLN